MLHSVPLLFCLFLRILLPFFASFIYGIFFTVYFCRPLSVLPLCFLFALPLSSCWYYSCFILNTGSTCDFLHQERRCSSCGPCRPPCAVQQCIASAGWVLVLISGIAEHHWHMRCALQVCWLQQGCVRVCLSVCLSVCYCCSKGEVWRFIYWDLRFLASYVSAKGQHAEWRTP